MFGGQGRIRKSYLKLTAHVCEDSCAAQVSSDGKETGSPSESNLHSEIQLHPWTEGNAISLCPKG